MKLKKEVAEQKNFKNKMNEALTISENTLRSKEKELIKSNQDNMHLLQRQTDMEHQLSTTADFMKDKNRDIEDLKSQLQIQVQKQCQLEIEDVKVKADTHEIQCKLNLLKEKSLEDKNKWDYELSLLHNELEMKETQNRETKIE